MNTLAFKPSSTGKFNLAAVFEVSANDAMALSRTCTCTWLKATVSRLACQLRRSRPASGDAYGAVSTACTSSLSVTQASMGLSNSASSTLANGSGRAVKVSPPAIAAGPPGGLCKTEKQLFPATRMLLKIKLLTHTGIGLQGKNH